MKKIASINVFAFMAVLSALIFTSCLKDNLTRTYTIMTPVLKTKQEVIAAIKSDQPKNIGTAGKFYLYGRYIFLNEVNKGVHVIDNADPSNPQPVAFISIPGNLDIAVKGNYLYADLYTELLTLDISNPQDVKLLKVVEDVFPERQYGSNFNIDDDLVIVDWQKKDTTVETDGEQRIGFGCINCMAFDAASSTTKSNSFVPGIAGSMSRFAIVQDYLYAVNMSSIKVHDISSPAFPLPVNTKLFGWNIETIYPFKDKLFIGSSTGMFIFNIDNLSDPVQQGQFNHFDACDPVVADDNYAYVTLRTGSRCFGVVNQLDVINVQDVMSPSLIKTYPLTNPHGLALDGNTLFVCDGSAGLKVFDASDPAALKQISHLMGMSTFDVIAWNKRLYLVTESSLKQYDYTDPGNLKLLSTISINR